MPKSPFTLKLRGNYDDQCERLLVETGAEATVIMVLGGVKGSGFSVSGRMETDRQNLLSKIPELLRSMADSIQLDFNQRSKT